VGARAGVDAVEKRKFSVLAWNRGLNNRIKQLILLLRRLRQVCTNKSSVQTSGGWPQKVNSEKRFIVEFQVKVKVTFRQTVSTRVEARSNTSTVTLRVVGGAEKGESQI
jgi:hypothetical protein